MEKYTIKHFEQQFSDEDSCLEFIKQARWPDGVHCAKCNRVTNHYRIKGRKVYSCEFCGSHVSPTADTIFHKSRTPLKTWFHATFLMASTRTGISAKQLERETGVTYKTAWRMFTQIRKLMAQEGGVSLFGEVEVDETYIGGLEKNKHESKKLNAGRGTVGKTVVVGMVQRKGNAVVEVKPDSKASTIVPMVQRHVHPYDATVYTDEHAPPTITCLALAMPTKPWSTVPSSTWRAAPIPTTSKGSGATPSGVSTAFTTSSAPSISKATWTPTSTASIIETTLPRCSFSF